jgi:hypothetical protein
MIPGQQRRVAAAADAAGTVHSEYIAFLFR